MTPQDIIKYGTAKFVPALRRNSYSKTFVVVVGCGGTGGRMIPLLAQHIINHNKTIASNPGHKEYLMHPIQLLLIDPDTVEAKNLKRQNFFEFDISKNKAQVFAERYSALFGLDIKFSSQFFDKFAEETNMAGMYDTNFIIFDCTDNINARRSIESFKAHTIIISCGNEDTFGQVLVSTGGGTERINELYNQFSNLKSHIEEIEKAIGTECIPTSKSYKLTHLPTLLELHPTFKDTIKPSCTDIVLENDQSMPINSLVAQLAYNAFYKIISGQELNYNLVRCNINNTFSTDFISYPMHALNLFIKTLFVESNKNTIEILAEIKKAGGHTRFSSTVVMDLLNKYGYQAICIAKCWCDYNRRYRTDPSTIPIIAKIESLEKERIGG